MLKMEKYGDRERRSAEFWVIEVFDVYEYHGKWDAYVVGRTARGEAMKTLEFDTKAEAEGCNGMHFLVNW